MKISISNFLLPLVFFFSFSLLSFPADLFAVDRGMTITQGKKSVKMKPVSIRDSEGNEVGLFSESHALVIGVSRYDNGWPQLPGVLNDIRMVREALENHGFNVVVVEDPDKKQLEDAIHQFIYTFGQKIDTRLVFYFAGHGYTMKLAYGGDMGYIVPRDAPDPKVDQLGFLEKAIDMQQFEVYSKRMQAKHALFLFDSCFSGSIFSTSRAIPENISYKTSLPVRQFITAGSANESVPDESIFRAQFITALEGEGDMDKDGYITGVELGEYLQKTVVNYSKGYQHPQYGKIRDRNLDKGDFVFPMKQAKLTPPPAPGSAPAIKAPAPLALKGHLQINVNVSSARVMVNDKFVGVAKMGKPLNLLNIPTGRKKVHLETDGFPALDRQVIIVQNQWAQEAFEFSDKPQPVADTQRGGGGGMSQASSSKSDVDECWDDAEGALLPC